MNAKAKNAIYYPQMKKLILSATLMAFAIAVQAGEAKTAKDKSACCAEKAVLQTKATGGTCPIAAQQAKAASANKCSATTTASASACSGATSCKEMPTKQALLSPKAAAEATKRL